MCGIFGFYNKGNQLSSSLLDKNEIVSKLSSQRGKEASGFLAFDKNANGAILKSDLDGSKVLKTKEYQALKNYSLGQNFSMLIGHSRIATHGSQLKDINNQPVISDNQTIAGVHNGIITNIDLLWKLAGRTDTIPELDTKVLIEYLSALMAKKSLPEVMKECFLTIEGAFSLAILIPSLSKLILSTNTGSLYTATHKKSKTIHFASESVFFDTSAFTQNDYEIQKIQPGIVYVFSEEETNVYNIKNELLVSEYDSISPFVLKDFSLKINTSKAADHYTFVNDIRRIKKHDFQYDKIYAIRRCSKCILPATTPFITFDQIGVCNFCREHQFIQHKGLDSLKIIADKYRKGNGEPDCMAAFSGGRDSAYGLHFLKKELGLQPLAYTYDWGMVTDLARKNQARILGKLGIEHIVVSADITMKRRHIRQNILAWMKKPDLGMVPIFMEGDKQCEFYADRLMKKYNLKLMFFFRGNELEKEEFKNGHCGIKDADPGGVIHHLPFNDKVKLLMYYGKQYLLNPAYINESFFDTGLAYFSTYIQKHDYQYLWHYVPWNEDIIVNTIKNEYNWESSKETKATWRTDDGTSAFYNYIYYNGQGFTENDSFRSRQVREGIITREQAIALVNEENKPRYESLTWYFDQVGLDGDEVLTVVDNMKKLY